MAVSVLAKVAPSTAALRRGARIERVVENLLDAPCATSRSVWPWSASPSRLIAVGVQFSDPYGCRRQDSESGPVAQWLEQGTHNPLVGGSNPSGPTSSEAQKTRCFKPFLGSFCWWASMSCSRPNGLLWSVLAPVCAQDAHKPFYPPDPPGFLFASSAPSSCDDDQVGSEACYSVVTGLATISRPSHARGRRIGTGIDLVVEAVRGDNFAG